MDLQKDDRVVYLEVGRAFSASSQAPLGCTRIRHQCSYKLIMVECISVLFAILI